MRDTAIGHHAERIQSVSKAVLGAPDLANIWLRSGEASENSRPKSGSDSSISTFISCGFGSSCICKKNAE